MDQDIAVIGMAARLPDAPTVADYWRNLVTGRESVRAFDDAELLANGVSARLLRDPRYVKSGVVLDGFDEFDPEFFGLGPKEAAIMDPQHRVFLECAWEALEDAARPPSRFDGQIGVFAGCGMGSYFTFQVLRNRQLLEEVGLFLLRHTGNDKDFLATRVSYCFDLKGPSVNVQTACSTSLVGIHMACQSLLSGETDMALAGGVTIEMPHRHGYLYQDGEILSPDGHCRAFDHRSRGTIFGSGAGVVVLRRLADAIESGDHIYAVVKGTAINNDGAGKVGYLAPSVDGQAAAVATAHALAGIDPADIGYVECHGTGTEIGDPIEVSALQQAFAGTTRRQYCGLGSVKTNIGHLDTAAGVASFIKVCLALHHGQLPPTLNYEAPNPLIDFGNSPFFVNAELRPWPRGPKPRIAGVNSLGVGGTNAHALLADAPEPTPVATPPAGPQLLVWSARNNRSLDDYARRLAQHLRDTPEHHVGEVASNLAHGRHAFARRRVTVAQDRDEAVRLLEGEDPRRVYTHTATESAQVVFLLPGGGAQYRHMGRGLHRSDAVFREHVDKGLALLAAKLDVDLREVWLGDAMTADEVERAFDRPSVQLPAIFLTEYALAQSWKARGVEPAALLGHSLGENTAACLAGVFSFEDALRLVTLRGQLFERITGGGMVSVPLSAEQCRTYLSGNLDLATINAPELCVVSGPDAELDAFAARLAENDVEVQRVKIAIAAHSRLLEPILADFGAFLRSIRLHKPTLPLISNRTGTWITEAQATDPQYWVDHLRNTVHFAEGVELLLRDNRNVFLEIGPGRTLSSLTRLHPAWNADRSAIASLRHPDERLDDDLFLRAAHARLWAAGVEVPLAELVPEPQRRLSLPTYAFRHQRYWVDADPEGVASAAEHDPTERVDDIAGWQWLPEWRRSDAPAPAGAPEPGTWLVFFDELGVGKRLAARLRERKLDVVEVHLGDSFGKLGEGRYALAPELGREGYDALVRDLAATGRQLRGVVHGWLLTKDRGFRPGSSFFHRCEEQGFYSLFFLAQALGGEELPEDCRIVVLGNELGGPPHADGRELVCPEKATVLGPGLCIPRELAGMLCAVVDLPVARTRRGRVERDTVEQLATLAERELAARDSGVFAWRGGERFRLEHVARELAPAKGELPARLRERGTYLISGGLGGIGSLVAEWLARTCKARLVLMTRRELPAREQWDACLAASGGKDAVAQAIQKVRWLESLGAEVHVAAADVADVVQVRAALAAARQRLGPVHGLFHAAGVIADGLMAGKEQATIERVLAPKVHGALVLEEVLGDEPLDFTVLFSSTSATLGPPGQVDYVAANAFLNAMARRRTAAGKPTMALQWGTWNRVGMTASLDAGRGASGGRPEAVAEPLFDERVQVGAEETVLTGKLGDKTHWLLDEHRTSQGHALVPGTGFLEIAAETLAAVGENGPFEVRDLYFFRPLYVPDGRSRTMRVHLRPSIEGYELLVESEIAFDDHGGSGKHGWQTHAQARLVLGHVTAAAPIDVAAIAARCGDVRRPSGADWIPSPQEANLRFGPRWRVVRELRYGDGEALATLALDEAFAADLDSYRLHPALLDLATGFAMELVPDYDQKNLWVPLAYRSFEVHDRLPRQVCSWVRRCAPVGTGGDLVAVDLVIATPDGRVLVEVEGFQMKRLAVGQEFALAGDPAGGGDAADHRSGGVSGAEQLLAENIQKGIRPAEGMEALARLLSGPLATETMVTPVPLPGLVHELDKAQMPTAEGGTRFARPELDNEYVAPRDDVEQGLVRIWEELLGIDSIGVQDDFFTLGGHSLIAVRLFAKIKKTFRIDYPMSVLFEAPTIERLGAALKRDGVSGGGAAEASAPTEAPQSRYRHLVAMHPSRHGDGTPFFLVAGMFGNVLNLRHLAQLIGADRPFYGLQARGLFGDMQPHLTFEEAARDYLQELRQVQPHGPYLLGGFSGGGITAYEMARQLRAAGEEVAMLVMLDTPLPLPVVASRSDRIKIQLQRIRREGFGYLGTWIKRRATWELERLRKRFGVAEETEEEPATFHSQAIEAAFRTSLLAYQLQPEPLRVWLFRPRLPKVYDLGGGRFANKDRELVFEDNRWTPYVQELHVIEVPGDHDGMVLEPNVRSLAAVMRQAIATATSPAPPA
ncbi:MAG: SDR family NAD(P)-dependent oxidoreductase [Planctomycetes bacterium]|nr:SDR family NAD(P)-dependent oxidoreductase [Planctomycetota bacterium]